MRLPPSSVSLSALVDLRSSVRVTSKSPSRASRPCLAATREPRTLHSEIVSVSCQLSVVGSAPPWHLLSQGVATNNGHGH